MDRLRSDIDAMDAEIQALTNSKDSLEKFARETYHFAAPGEDVYIIEEQIPGHAGNDEKISTVRRASATSWTRSQVAPRCSARRCATCVAGSASSGVMPNRL